MLASSLLVTAASVSLCTYSPEMHQIDSEKIEKAFNTCQAQATSCFFQEKRKLLSSHINL